MFSSSDTDDEPSSGGGGGKLVIDLDADTDLTPRKPNIVQSGSSATVSTARRKVNLDGSGDMSASKVDDMSASKTGDLSGSKIGTINTLKTGDLNASKTGDLSSSKIQTNSLGKMSITSSCRSTPATGPVRDSVAAKTWIPTTIVSASGRVNAQKVNESVASGCTDTDRTSSNNLTNNISSAFLTSSITATTTTCSRARTGITTTTTTTTTQPSGVAACVNQTVAKLDSCVGRQSPFNSLISAAAASKTNDGTASLNSGNKHFRMKIKGIQSSPTVSVTSSLPLIQSKSSITPRQGEEVQSCTGDSVGMSERDVKSSRSPASKKCRSSTAKDSLGKSNRSNVDDRSTASPLERTSACFDTNDVDGIVPMEGKAEGKSSSSSSSRSSSSSCSEMQGLYKTDNSQDPYEFNVKVEDFIERPCKKLKAVERCETASSPMLWLDHGTDQQAATRDVAVDACHVGLVTDPDCLGPCEPGSSVTLEGIVWNETDNGLLVVNVTWRGRTYVGTLMDATKHHWAPPRSTTESPTNDLDGRTPKGRGGKRGRATSSGISRFDCSDRKLRSNRCTNSNNNSNNNNRMHSLPPPLVLPPPSPAKSDSGGSSLKRTRVELMDACPSKVQKIDSSDSSSQLIECPQSGCCKKFRSTHALRFHQTKAHKSLCSDVNSDSNGDSDCKGSKGSEAKAAGKENKKNENSDTKSSQPTDMSVGECDSKAEISIKIENMKPEESSCKTEAGDKKVEDDDAKLICDEKIDFTKMLKEEIKSSDEDDNMKIPLDKADPILSSTAYTAESLAETKSFSNVLGSSKIGLGNLNLPLVASPSMLVQVSSLVGSEPNIDRDLLGKSFSPSLSVVPKSSTNDAVSDISRISTTSLGEKLSPASEDSTKSMENCGRLNPTEEDVRKMNASAGISLALLCNSDLATQAFHPGSAATPSNQHVPSLSLLTRPGSLPFNYGPIDSKGQVFCDPRTNIRSSADILNDARNSGMYLTGNAKTSLPLDNNLRVAPLASSNMAAIEAVNSQLNRDGDLAANGNKKSIKCESNDAVDCLDRSATHSPAYSDISDANENAPMLEKESEEQDSSVVSGVSVSLAITSSSCGLNVSSIENSSLVGKERVGAANTGYLYSPLYGQPPYLTPVVTGSNTNTISGLPLPTSATLTNRDGQSYIDCLNTNSEQKNRKRNLSGSDKTRVLSNNSSISGMMSENIRPNSTDGDAKSSDVNIPLKPNSREPSERPSELQQGFTPHIPLMHPMFSQVPGFAFSDPRFTASQATNSWLMHQQQFLQQQRLMFPHAVDLTRLQLNTASSMPSPSPPQSVVKVSAALPTLPSLIPDKARTPLIGGEGDGNKFIQEKCSSDGGLVYSENCDSNRSKSRNESPASDSLRFLPNHHLHMQRQSLENSGSHAMVSKHDSNVGGTSKPSAVVAPQSRGSITSGSRPQSRHSDISDGQHDSNSRDSISRNADVGFSLRDRGTKRATDSDRPDSKTSGTSKSTSERGKGDQSSSRRSFPSVIKSKDDLDRLALSVSLPAPVSTAIPSSLASTAPPFPHMFGHYLGHAPMQYASGFEHPGMYPPGIGPVIGYAAGPSGYLPNPLLTPAPPLLLSPTRSQPSDIKPSLVGPLPPHSAASIPAYFSIAQMNDNHLHKIHELKDVGKSGGGSRVGGAADRPKERVAPSPPEGDGVRGRPDSRSGRCASVGMGKEPELHSSPPTQRHHHMHHHMHVQFGHPIYPLYGGDAAAAALLASQQATSASLQRPPYMGKS